jgi:hypothetical protein
MQNQTYYQVKNLCGSNKRILTCKYKGATNNSGSRVIIKDRHFKDSISIPFDHMYNTEAEVAVAHLLSIGFKVVGINSTAIGLDEYIIIIENWDSEQRITTKVK